MSGVEGEGRGEEEREGRGRGRWRVRKRGKADYDAIKSPVQTLDLLFTKKARILSTTRISRLPSL